MRRYFLSFNEFTNQYNLDYGAFDRNRENLGKIESKDLGSKLSEVIPIHKEILLYVETDLDLEVRRYLKDSFKNTRVTLEFISDLRKIKQPKL